MDAAIHTMQDLFAQLGLPNEPQEVRAFITRHRPLDGNIRLKDAPFWNPAQSALIQQKLGEDSDWSILVDELSARLRQHPQADDLRSA